MKIDLELNILDDQMFLNFWNHINGDDVICEIKDGKLYLIGYDDEGNELPEKEITFIEFCNLVKAKVER